MRHYDGTKEGSPLIDTRQVMYIALHAVTMAYVQGTLPLSDLRSFQSELYYDSDALEQTFGRNHPFFDLAIEIECQCSYLSTFPEKFSEAQFREEMRKAIGVGLTSSNLVANPTSLTFV